MEQHRSIQAKKNTHRIGIVAENDRLSEVLGLIVQIPLPDYRQQREWDTKTNETRKTLLRQRQLDRIEQTQTNEAKIMVTCFLLYPVIRMLPGKAMPDNRPQERTAQIAT